MMPDVETETRKEQSYQTWVPEIVLIAGLTSASVIGNFVVTRYFWMNYVRPPFEPILSAFLGLLIAQACLPAIWCGLGRGWLFGRITPTFVFLMAMSSYLGTLMLMGGGIPVDIAAIISVVSLALFVVLQVPLWSVRASTGFALSKSGMGGDRSGRPQFNVRQMFIVTAIAAAISAMVRGLAPFLGSGDALSQPIGEIAFFFTLFIVFVSILCLFAAAAVFSQRRRWAFGGMLALIWIGGSLAVTWSLKVGCSFIFVPGIAFLRVFTNTLAFSAMLVVAIVAVLMVFRGLGYRMCNDAAE